MREDGKARAIFANTVSDRNGDFIGNAVTILLPAGVKAEHVEKWGAALAGFADQLAKALPPGEAPGKGRVELVGKGGRPFTRDPALQKLFTTEA